MKSTVIGSTLLLAGILTTGCDIANAQDTTTFSGKVNRVWEDGFRLKTASRSITVDSYDVCGDNTARHIQVGNQITVTGEFEWGEFDAFSITDADGEEVCQ